MKSEKGKQASRLKHVPERTCVSCRTTKPKKEMIRLVLTADSLVEIDLSGKKNGRGAYLCQSYTCWQQGLTKNRLEYALKTRLSASNRQSLLAFAENLPGRS